MKITSDADHNDDSGSSPPQTPQTPQTPQNTANTANTANWTLRDLPFGDLPPQLADPFLAPEGSTIIYGKGGLGKGLVSLYLAQRLIRSGDIDRIGILDFENHPREWGRRARLMGFTDAELGQIIYRTPYGHYWSDRYVKGPLVSVAQSLRKEFGEWGLDYLFIDSYTTATSTGDSMGGAEAAGEFFNGLARLGFPSCTIAHVAGGQEKFPDKPFGSVFVHNLARETWAAARNDTDDMDVFSVELHNKKRNEGNLQLPQVLTFKFTAEGIVTALASGKVTIKQELVDILSTSTKPVTVAAIAKALRQRTGQTFKEDTVYRSLSRNRRLFRATSDVPQLWSVADKEAYYEARAEDADGADSEEQF